MGASLLVPASDVELAVAEEKRRDYAQRSKADGTWRVYDGHWKRFVGWCTAGGVDAGPPAHPGAVADYIIHMGEQRLSAATMRVAVAAIGHRHRLAGAVTPLDHPQVREVLSGAIRIAAREQTGRGPAEPLLPDDLRKLITRLKPGLVGQRDLALLTFGLAGGFRREELCRLTFDNLRFEGNSIMVHLPWSKADQAGEGHTRRICRGEHIELCPVRNLELWLAASGLNEGWLFRPVFRGHPSKRPLSPRRVDQIVREYTRLVLAGDPHALSGRKYSAHSLRSGLCTAAALAGKPEHEIREHVGHKSAATTARYIRGAKLRQSTVTQGIGL
jgi:integrase